MAWFEVVLTGSRCHRVRMEQGSVNFIDLGKVFFLIGTPWVVLPLQPNFLTIILRVVLLYSLLSYRSLGLDFDLGLPTL